MKFFISQKMKGRSDEEILSERHEVIEAIKKHNPKAEIIDSFFESAPDGANPLWYLSKSLELLSTADMAVFVDDCHFTSRGCRIEDVCCREYGIDSCAYYTDQKDFVANG